MYTVISRASAPCKSQYLCSKYVSFYRGFLAQENTVKKLFYDRVFKQVNITWDCIRFFIIFQHQQIVWSLNSKELAIISLKFLVKLRKWRVESVETSKRILCTLPTNVWVCTAPHAKVISSYAVQTRLKSVYIPVRRLICGWGHTLTKFTKI